MLIAVMAIFIVFKCSASGPVDKDVTLRVWVPGSIPGRANVFRFT